MYLEDKHIRVRVYAPFTFLASQLSIHQPVGGNSLCNRLLIVSPLITHPLPPPSPTHTHTQPRTLIKQGPYALRPVVKKVLVITPGSLVKVRAIQHGHVCLSRNIAWSGSISRCCVVYKPSMKLYPQINSHYQGVWLREWFLETFTIIYNFPDTYPRTFTPSIRVSAVWHKSK